MSRIHIKSAPLVQRVSFASFDQFGPGADVDQLASKASCLLAVLALLALFCFIQPIVFGLAVND